MEALGVFVMVIVSLMHALFIVLPVVQEQVKKLSSGPLMMPLH